LVVIVVSGGVYRSSVVGVLVHAGALLTLLETVVGGFEAGLTGVVCFA
jgi:hypothetical protein